MADEDEYLNKICSEISDMNIGEIVIKQNEFGKYIYYEFTKKYYGEIIPVRYLRKNKEFCKKICIENVVMRYKKGKNWVKNGNVCETCKKIKFYPNVVIVLIYGTTNELLNKSEKTIIILAFCKHVSVAKFLNMDFEILNTESSSDEFDF